MTHPLSEADALPKKGLGATSATSWERSRPRDGPPITVGSVAVTALVLDVGGVLVESPFHAAIRWVREWDLPMEAFAALYAEYSRVVGPDEEPPIWHQVECGKVPLATFVEVMRSSFETLLPEGHRARGLTVADFNPFAGATGHPEMEDLARQAQREGLGTAILTNNVAEWGAWREVVDLELFDHVVDSCEVGLRKPDPAIYQLTANRLGVAATQILFLDDHGGNVAAARAAGWRAIEVGEDIAAAADDARRVLGWEVA